MSALFADISVYNELYVMVNVLYRYESYVSSDVQYCTIPQFFD